MNNVNQGKYFPQTSKLLFNTVLGETAFGQSEGPVSCAIGKNTCLDCFEGFILHKSADKMIVLIVDFMNYNGEE